VGDVFDTEAYEAKTRDKCKVRR